MLVAAGVAETDEGQWKVMRSKLFSRNGDFANF
jgi:hypothetical protein